MRSRSKVDVADNIDLYTIIHEFEEGYEMKFGRRPRLVKKLVRFCTSGILMCREYADMDCAPG